VSKPLVSITSAFYNTEPFLVDMVRSIFSQTFDDWELILLDDGSTDRSLQIAQSIDDPRVKVFSNGQNLGIPKSLNRLTELSSGKYIARMDADDMSGVDRIRRQVEFLESNSDVDVLGCGKVNLGRNYYPLGHNYAAPDHAQICKAPDKTYRMAHPTIIARKQWFLENKYDESVVKGEDFNLFLRTYTTSRYANIPEPLFFYRLQDSFSLKKQIVFRRSIANFVSAYHFNRGNYLRAFEMYMYQYLKFSAECLYCMAGAKERLLKRRYQAISDTQRQTYIEEIKKIRSTTLPLKDV